MNVSILELRLEAYFKRTFPSCVECEKKGCDTCPNRPRPKNDLHLKHPEYTGAI